MRFTYGKTILNFFNSLNTSVAFIISKFKKTFVKTDWSITGQCLLKKLPSVSS